MFGVLVLTMLRRYSDLIKMDVVAFSRRIQTSIVSQLLRCGANPTLLNCNQDKPSGKTHTHTVENQSW